VGGASLFEAGLNGGGKGIEGCIKFGIETLLFYELPQPFNQIEVWRIGWQEEQFDVELGGQIDDQIAALIAGVIEDQREGY